MADPPAVDLDALAAPIRVCTLCRLHEGRTHAVPGEGGPASGIMLVGEAPGRQEDLAGRPFCGAAGRNLDAALAAAGLRRPDLFVTSIVKCRPPGNRDPRRDEVEACHPYLEAQVAALRPRVIVALGRHALAALVADPPARFVDARGAFWGAHDAVPVWVSLHPAAVIYRQSWREAYLDDWSRFGAWARAGAPPAAFVPGPRTLPAPQEA